MYCMDLNLLSSAELDTLNRLIKESGHIALVCHSHPDGDSLGAALAWSHCLEKIYGKTTTIIAPNTFPDFLLWMPGTERIVKYNKKPTEVEQLLQQADLVCCMDFGGYDRVDEMQPVLEAVKAPVVMFDHHLNPTLQAAVAISHPDLSSTCEVLFRVVWQLGIFEQLDKKFAVPCYTGMMTDTGGFTYNSSRPEIFYIICQLLTKKLDKDKIYRNVFNNYSTWAIRLRGYVMNQKLNVLEEKHATYYSVSREEMEQYHFVRGDLEGLVNEPLRIKGIRMSISLKEDDRQDNRVWVSLRSVDHYSVEEVATRFFNGGGHLNASGGHIDGTLEEAEQTAREAIEWFAEKYR